jgi:3-oxoacyl-[acyl-carrier protein] reductase
MKRAGRVINMTSIVGITGNAGQLNYAASKGGVIALTKSLAKELASRNVCVNAIAPGFIETDMTEKIPENDRRKLMESIPLQRLGSADDIAAMTVFLASKAASYITGQTLTVDGGMAV